MPNTISEKAADRFRLIVIGVSTGGVHALKLIFNKLPPDFAIPILVVQHISPESGKGLATLLDELCRIRVKEAEEEEMLTPACVYIAPPNYHMLVERGGSISLSDDPPVNFARPSVDVLFESAAAAFGRGVIGVILTGAGFDGGRGIQRVKEQGGLVIVQEPEDAEASSMPENALSHVSADHVAPLKQIPELLMELLKSA